MGTYFYLIVLPTLGLILILSIKTTSKVDAIISAGILLTFNYYLSLTGNWINLDSVYISLIPSILFNLIILIQLVIRLIRPKKLWNFKWHFVIKVGILILTLWPITKHIFVERPSRGLILDYPLKNGTYYVIQGGLVEFMNYHLVSMKKYNNEEMRYAVDIVKINKQGSIKNEMRGSGPVQHEIFLDTVYSPVDGIVIEVRDDQTDYKIEKPIIDPEQKGNHLVIKYGDIFVVHGHLKMNSIMVAEGDSVRTGQPIALIGHNGQSTIPHLHLHALVAKQTYLDKGDSTEYIYPIPMFFKGYHFLEKNDYIN